MSRLTNLDNSVLASFFVNLIPLVVKVRHNFEMRDFADRYMAGAIDTSESCVSSLGLRQLIVNVNIGNVL